MTMIIIIIFFFAPRVFHAAVTLSSSMQNYKLNLMLLFGYRVTSFKYGNARVVEVEVCTEGRWSL